MPLCRLTALKCRPITVTPSLPSSKKRNTSLPWLIFLPITSDDILVNTVRHGFTSTTFKGPIPVVQVGFAFKYLYALVIINGNAALWEQLNLIHYPHIIFCVSIR